MFRIRRYRALLVFAVFITAILIRFTHIRDWESYHKSPEPSKERPHEALTPAKEGTKTTAKAAEKIPTTTGGQSVTSNVIAIQPGDPTVPKYTLPDRKPPTKETDEDSGFEDIHFVAPPGRNDLPVSSAPTASIYWSKQPEHFPVPTESLIHLPTGAPISIPKIQYLFKDETTDEKISREKKQNMVKGEFLRAWSGYKKFAWGHDELSPVSTRFRDPFCGWAATLVDALDTLWIMGLHDEFEEALKAVEKIDFTTTPRMEIPVFETTIRYLGGLLAAYDVSGGKFQILLDKAVELAEILMGAFDTPNRMPILHYLWKPAFASQPHRASPNSNLAELGSLSMEFTRLAQLTGEKRYYDAVARVTNALSEWQDRNSTNIPGVFPDDVDATGCNRTATLIERNAKKEAALAKKIGDPQGAELLKESPAGYNPPSIEQVNEPKPKKNPSTGENTLEMQVLPGVPGKARIQGWEDGKATKRDFKGSENLPGSTTVSSPPPPAANQPPVSTTGGLARRLAPRRPSLDSSDEWDCVEQGLEAYSTWGNQVFSMGGGQDSTYEYFPKQHLLLGGLEEVYQKMYMKTIVAIREHMLFRPMTPENHDILISGKVSRYNQVDEGALTPEVTHLTCFIGGMVGMSAKIFGIDGDLEIAKKLTDGCVWAYGATQSGIMPETSEVIACESAEKCTWNETLYYERLDPSADYREANLLEYIKDKERLDAEAKEMNLFSTDVAREKNGLAKAEAVGEPQRHAGLKETVADLSPKFTRGGTHPAGRADASTGVTTSSSNALPKKDSSETKSDHTGASKPRDEPISLKKRKSGSASKMDDPEKESMFKQKSANTEAELKSMAGGRELEKATMSQKPLPAETLPDPLRPLSHREYVESRIKQEALPPGFTSIHNRKYILRPEAIESVWYMYRITGDKSWQDKGWKMFEAVIKATSTKYGHSAIYDVTADPTFTIDEMESFWLAETLKYFYLLFSTPETISLDDWVLNTEAHPFKRPAA